MNQLRDDLIAARALIDAPEKWGKGEGVGFKCSLTAINHITGHHYDRSRWFAASQSLTSILPEEHQSAKVHPVVIFNDAKETTYDDVMALFDLAIERATE